ncbi:hypothetical protein BH11ACT8_BH11ACT8_19500 [soil metagenome]
MLGCLAVPALAVTSGQAVAVGTTSGVVTASAASAAPAAPTARRQPTPASRARTAVRVAVQKARRGAPIPTRTTPPLDKLNGSRTNLGACDYGKNHDNSGGRLCKRGDKSAKRSVVVIGDSHGKHWVPAVEKAADRYGWASYYLVKEQCTASMVANGDPAQAHPTEPWAACQDFRDFAVQSVKDLQADLVIISTSIPTKGVFTDKGYIRNQKQMVGPYKQGFRKLFHQLKQVTDGRIVRLRDVPGRKPKSDPLNCFRKRGNTLRDCLSPEKSQAGRVRLVDASVQVAKASGVHVADPTSFFCWDGVCPAAVGKGLLPYRNTGHITVDYSKRLTGAIAQLVRMK